MAFCRERALKSREALNGILKAARAAWNADGAALVACQEDGFDEKVAAIFATSLERSYAVGWDLVVKPTNVGNLPRTGQVMNAPSYTSTKHPWPREQGVYAIPIVQLDLEWIADRSGVSLGTGLVQLWQSERKMITRVIPRADLRDPAAPVPDFVPGENLASYHYDFEDEPRPRFVSNPHNIVDANGPYIFGDSGRDDILTSFIDSPEASPVLRDALSSLWQAMTEGRAKYKQITRLLGSFDGIQTHPEDHPQTLFSSDDDTILNTGDSGLISLHFDRDADDNVRLGGNFQCY